MEEEKTVGSNPVKKAVKAKARAPRPPAPQIDYEKLAEMVASKMISRVPPVTITKGVETPDFPVGQPADIILPDGTLAMGGSSIEAVPGGALQSGYMNALAFMEETLIVMVAETEDVNAENPVIVGVNGVFAVFHRGVPKHAKRKFVEGLVVKSSRVSTPEFTNSAGERSFMIKQHNAHKYPFTVIHDPNPLGIEWLTRRMAEQ